MLVKERKNAVLWESGDRYGNVILTGKSYLNEKSIRMVEYICVCGKTGWTRIYNLKSGDLKSCGCMQYKSRIFSGIRSHHLYSLWSNMIQRCHNPQNDNYPDYGARGIFVCDEWRQSKIFLKWADNSGWANGLQLDRIDNNKNYCPENCRWATRKEQNSNKRNSFTITAFGETKIATEWGKDERCKTHPTNLRYRISTMNWDAEKAITTPPFKN